MPQPPATPTSASRGVTAPSLHEAGALRFATDRGPWQRSLRWTSPYRDRRLLLLGGLFAVALTVLQLVGFALAMRSHRPWTAPRHNEPIQVVLIDSEPEVPPPPEPEPPIVARPSRIAIAPPQMKKAPPPPLRSVEDSHETQARIGSAGTATPPTPPPQLFNPDGSIRLNAETDAVIAPKASANPREAAKARWAQIQQGGKNPLDCHRTRFANAFAPDESVGSGVARKYLSWVGLYDPHDTEKRAARAAEGCDPPK
jgi:hypothetical protein